MKLRSAKFYNFKRTAVTGYEYIEINPVNMCQVFLGTNGCGKSSIMRELSLMAADPAAYGKNGCKDIEFEDKGSIYRTVSFLNPTSHYFFKDGVALCTAANAKVHAGLLYEHTRYDAFTDDLIKGRLRFTAMGPQQRREAFTKMSNVDYGFALGLYNRAKERARDIAGALKLAKTNLVVETGKVLSEEEHAKLEQEVEELHRLLGVLFAQRSRIDTSSADVYQRIKNTLDMLLSISNQVLASRPMPPAGKFYPDYTSMIEAGKEYHMRIRELRTIIASKSSDLNDLLKDTQVLDNADGETADSLRLRVNSLELALQEDLQSLNATYADVDTIYEAASNTGALESTYEDVVAILTEMPNNEELFFSTARRNEINETLNTSITRISSLSIELSKLEGRRSHLEFHKSNGPTVCPKCDHRWIVGFSEQEYKEVVSKCTDLNLELEDLRKATAALEEQQQQINQFIQNYMLYKRLRNNVKSLEHVWSVLDKDNLSFLRPQECVGILSQFYRDIPTLKKIHAKKIELIKAHVLLEALEKADMLELRSNKQRAEAIEKEIEKLTREQMQLQIELNDHERYERAVYDKLELGKTIQDLASECHQDVITYHETIDQEAIQSAIHKIQSLLTSKELALNSFNNQRGKVEELQNSIAQMQDDEEAAKLIAKELSPTEGIIAESLMTFINGFIEQMNVIIRMAWSYLLEIKPCSVDEDGDADLSYRFPMAVFSEWDIVKDVKDGSTGIREIIDLAYTITAMVNLGLIDYPLFLDEFGASFDDFHRVQAGTVIKNIQEQMNFEQMFLVTHYESSYGALSNVDIIVLSSANVIVSRKHNEHSVFKHKAPALPVLM